MTPTVRISGSRDPVKADVVVVGSGAFGASVAFHLARLGQTVIVVDRFAPVSQTSPRAAGVTAHVPLDDDLTRIGLRSIDKLLAFQADTGQPLNLHRNGAVKLCRSSRYESLIQEEIRRGRRFGVSIREITSTELSDLIPWIQSGGVASAWYATDECYFNPPDLPIGYVNSAQSLGAVVLSHTEVTGFHVTGSQIDYVLSSAGPIETSNVVCAAGAWTRSVMAMLDQDIPIVPTRHQLVITEPLDFVRPDHPTIRVVDAGVYIRPEKDALLVGAYESAPHQYPSLPQAPDFSIDSLNLDVEPLRSTLKEIADLGGWLATVAIRELRGGLPTITPDGRFIVDRLASPHNFFVLTGCNVMGLYCSPALGELLADWVVSGTAHADLEPFGLRRFETGEFLDTDRLLAACRQVYGHKFTHEWNAA